MDRLAFTSDLIADDIRCKLKVISKEDGEPSYITIWNIKGDRRQEVLNELNTIMELHGEDDEKLFNMFYTSLILEFTDLVIDTDEVLFLLNDSTLTGKMLMQEFNDMIYEIQYEIAMDNLQQTRNLAMALITKSTIDEMNYAQERVDHAKDKRDKNIFIDLEKEKREKHLACKRKGNKKYRK